jgi:hypothetical protein
MNRDAKIDVDDFVTPVRDEEITPEHRAWMNDQIRDALERKARGEMTYTSLEEVRRKFGFDAS